MKTQSASNQGGEQMWRFEQKRIPTVPISAPTLKLLCGIVVACRASRFGVKAEVLEEEMRRSTLESTGIGGQTSAERSIEITLGRTYYQQGLVATCKDWPHKM